MSFDETVNLIGNENVTVDIDDIAMKPIGPDSTESSLIGRSHKQSIPFWDDERIFKRDVSNTTVVPSTHLSWNDINVKVMEPTTDKKSLIGLCMQRIKRRHDEPVKAKRDFILKNVFGIAQSGEVLAILGSSGSGKTTMLNVLTQRNLSGLQVDGIIRINGQQLPESEMRHICAYVQQDDLFMGSMTVKEHLTFYVSRRFIERGIHERKIDFLESRLYKTFQDCDNLEIKTANSLQLICISIAIYNQKFDMLSL
ncbi:unnamed protein product [Toxocara canis]|uniref:ABC transporter domain-containing protein n=1 Tax=Toxocara canis TaxID=6265 RepID=A0A183V6G9_TOXCA|nr:unnamed protein product [Toxocara canis]